MLPVSTEAGCGKAYTRCPIIPIPRGLYRRVSLVGAWRSLAARSVRDAEVGGSNPLAPTTYGYSEPLWEDGAEAVRDGRVGEVESGLPEASHLDPFEERLREHLAPLTAIGGCPCPAEIPEVADGFGGGNTVLNLLLLGLPFLFIEPCHRRFEGIGVAVAEVLGGRGLAFAGDAGEGESVRSTPSAGATSCAYI